MPLCDLCGKEVEKLVRAEIEGTELAVCEDCRKFGNVLGEVKSEEEIKEMLRGKASGTTNVVLERKKPKPLEEIEERIIPDFAEKIRKAREKRRMKQEEFAELLHEKESVIQKWEGGSLRPKIRVARKLERVLGIDLVEKVEEGKVELKGIKSGEMTLGDVIKVRRRKSD